MITRVGNHWFDPEDIIYVSVHSDGDATVRLRTHAKSGGPFGGEARGWIDISIANNEVDALHKALEDYRAGRKPVGI